MRKYLKNNWVVTIGGGILSVLLLRLIDTLFINNFLWDAIKNGFSSIAGFFNTEYSVKLYFLTLFFLSTVVATIGALYLMSRKRSNSVEMFQYPDWTEYTKDVFDGVQYRWNYTHQGMKTDIQNIAAYCNKCSCVLIHSRCPNCKDDYSWEIRRTPDVRPQGEIHALILHRIENGLYKNSPYFKT